MPIDYKQYHPKWSLISRLIRFHRAKNMCERCQVPNHSFVTRDKAGKWHFRFSLKGVRELFNNDWKPYEIAKEFECTYIVLTVAHLDHNKDNNRFNNLAALCQRCHLKHDLQDHILNRKYGRDWKKHQLKLEI